MADSGVDTSNESSDNPVFPRVSLEVESPPLSPRLSFEFEPPAIPLPPIPSLSLVPVDLGVAQEPHEYVGKMKHAGVARRRRRGALDGTARNQRLRLAASTNNAELVEKLLEAGADPDASDAHLRSPLHLAACRGFVDVVRALLKRGANPNSRDTLGNTPLHLAACTSHVAVVTELLKAGADERSNDAHGRTPLDLAQSKLRLIHSRATSGHPQEMMELVAEVRSVVDMMVGYLRVRARAAAGDTDHELESLCQRLEHVNTREQVHTEVQCLLDSLEGLKLR